MSVFMGKIALRNLSLASNNSGSTSHLDYGRGRWASGRKPELQRLEPTDVFHCLRVRVRVDQRTPGDHLDVVFEPCAQHGVPQYSGRRTRTAGTDGAAIDLAGAYDCLIDGLAVDTAFNGVHIRSGEAMRYRPWSRDARGMKPAHITLRNITTRNIKSNAISLQGDERATVNYLRSVISSLGHPADYTAQTDLISFSLDGFEVSADGAGVYLSGRGTIQNGKATHCGSGLVISDECSRFDVSKLTIINSTAMGIRANFGNAIWSPARRSPARP